MKLLKIDDKWEVEYDPANNDRPMFWHRHSVRHSTFDENNPTVAMFYALLEDDQKLRLKTQRIDELEEERADLYAQLEKRWTDVDPENPPAPHMVALYNDDCTAETLTKFDNSDDFYLGEGDSMDKGEVRGRFSKWIPAPEGFEPHFMTLTED